MTDHNPFLQDMAVETLSAPNKGDVPHGLKRVITFSDNSLLVPLFGDYDKHLAQIEASLGLSLSSRGNQLTLLGPQEAVDQAQLVLEELYGRLKQGLPVEMGDVDGALRMAALSSGPERTPGAKREAHLDQNVSASARLGAAGSAKKNKQRKEKLAAHSSGTPRITVRKKTLLPRSPRQANYIGHLQDTPMVFAVGPAGTGKTYLAVAQAVSAMLAGHVDRIVLSRPAVEAGENLGFLPGDMREKVDPYLRPLYDALDDLLPADFVERRMHSGEIEIAPLAFMRGRTLANAFVILDEAQNASVMQMKMFLTRFGENSQMVIAGDPSQVDLPPRTRSGLAHAVNTLGDVDDIAVVRFKPEDVVRHPLVGRIVDAYDAADRAERGEAMSNAS